MNTWKHCSVHGPGDENSWGCPECVRELRKAVAERDARIAELEKALRLSVKELVAWSEKINPFGWHFCCDSNVDGPENHNAECGVYSAIQEAVAVLGKGER